KRLLGYAMEYKWMFAAGILLMILMVGFELLGPFIAMMILDNHIKVGGNSIELTPIFKLLGLFFAIKVLHAIFSYFQTVILQKSGGLVVRKMRNDVCSHVQKLPFRYFDDLPAGKEVARITNDTETMLEMCGVVLSMFMVSELTVGTVSVIIFTINGWIGVMMLIFIPVVISWMILYPKNCNDYSHKKRQRNSDMNAMINESISCMPIIHIFN